MRVMIAAPAAFFLALAGCASLPALPDWGYRSIVVSSKPSDAVAACIAQAWRKSFASVTAVPGAREDEIEVDTAGRRIFEAEIIAQPVGSTVVYTTPYGFAQPIGHSFEEARSCAAK